MDAFELELKQGFLDEAAQLLEDTEQCFLGLEGSGGDPSLLEKIFRLAHNLKGSSRAVGFEQMGAFTHEFENFLLKLKNKELAVSPGAVTLLLKANDFIKTMVAGLKSDVTATFEFADLVAQFHSASGGEAAPEVPAAAPEAVPAHEDMASAPEAAPAAIEEAVAAIAPPPPPANKRAPAPPADESIRVSLARVEKLIDFIGELSILQAVLRQQSQASGSELLRKTVSQMGKVSKEIQDISMGLRMIPVKQTFQKMQRIVRDTAGMLDKKVNLILEGEETELDKTVLENIGDPLVHLIRNAVDHGVELPADRVKAGKPEVGTICLRAFHQGGRLVLEIQDDGKGINADVLTRKAIEKGILKPGTTLPEREAVNLIFHAGFSTKEVTTEVSGRGVGMDVVRTNIEALSGEIDIKTKVGEGTTFRISLPLTLAIIDGLVIVAGTDRLVVPLAQVHETIHVQPSQIEKRSGVGELFVLRGEPLPVFHLAALMGRAAPLAEPIGLVVRGSFGTFVLLVEDILWQQQVVVKKLGLELQGLKGFGGSTILGDGHPALILETEEIIRRASAVPAPVAKPSQTKKGVAA